MTKRAIQVYIPPNGTVPSLVPSPRWRDWLPAFAAHCIPLTTANQLGWTLLAPTTIRAQWNGDAAPAGVRAEPEGVVSGHFGHGILTVFVPWIMRTTPDVLLWVRGVPNYPIPDLYPLEGLIETDWHDGAFTMNYLLTPRRPVMIAAGTPLLQLVPYPRAWIESVGLELVTDGETWVQQVAAWAQWNADRATFNRTRQGSQRDQAYRQGRRHSGPPSAYGAPPMYLQLAHLPGQPQPRSFARIEHP